MKKSKSIVFVLTIFAFLFAIGYGCKSESDKYDAKISEIRDGRYVCADSPQSVEGMSGEREVPYSVDGILNGRKPFFIVTVKGTYATPPSYTTEIDGKAYEGSMSKHPFEESYSFCLDVNPKQTEITVTLKGIAAQEQAVTLTREQAPAVSHAQALSIARSSLSEPIAAHSKNGVFDGEIYLRLIVDPTGDTDKRFWYVAFCTEEDECFSLLADSESGEVIARKIA